MKTLGMDNTCRLILILGAIFLCSCKKPTYYSLTTNADPVEGGVVTPVSGRYPEGETITLTAKPAEEYMFSAWEGSVSGKSETIKVTMDSDKTISAKFTKKLCSLSVVSSGEGEVRPSVVQPESGYESGTTVQLTAVPVGHWVFHHWDGDLSGNENPVSLTMRDDLSVRAVFTMNLLEPSVRLKKLYYGWDLPGGWSHHFVSTDYNADGYPDTINCPLNTQEPTRSNLGFFLGQPDGSFVADPKNNNRILGQIWPRKQLCGDYNGDGVMDICMLGHGWDDEPYPGEYIIILMSSESGKYTDLRLTDYVGYFHGGSSADIDNDGDLDIFGICSWTNEALFLLNDGKGNFTPRYDLFRQDLRSGMYNAELYDIDNDGFIDLLIGGHDHEGDHYYEEGGEPYKNMPIVFWGNGQTFNHDNYTRLPKTAIQGMGIALDFEFYDIDGDGVEELLISRTGDGRFSIGGYNGWAIQVVKRNGRTFEDITEKLIPDASSYNKSGKWNAWIDVETVSGQTFLMGRPERNAVKLFEIKEGRMIRE